MHNKYEEVNMKRLSIFTALSLIILVSIYPNRTIAGPDHHGKHSHKAQKFEFNESRVMKHLSQLDLTEQQTTEITEVIKSAINSSKPTRVSLEEMHQRMRVLKRADAIDEVAIRSLSSEIANVEADLSIAHINNRKQVAALLTEVQREKLKNMKLKHKMRHNQ